MRRSLPRLSPLWFAFALVLPADSLPLLLLPRCRSVALSLARRTPLSLGIGARPRAAARSVSIGSMLGSVGSASPAAEAAAVENEAKLLSSVEDHYGGVVVEMKEAMDSASFVSVLRASISHWKEQGKRGVWIKLPIELVNLVEPAVAEGFWYHHAEPTYLMLVYWIPQSPHTIPANATHRVGVGAIVMNEKDKVLVVQEKTGILRGTGIWKFPTGVVDEGEDICAAAVREVKEETGIDAEFVEVLGFRQSHQVFFQKSDLFFVCLVRPLSFDIRKQDVEIEAVKWMPFEEYAAQPFCQKNELVKYIIEICSAKKNGKYSGFTPVPSTSFFSDQKNYFYLDSHLWSRQGSRDRALDTSKKIFLLVQDSECSHATLEHKVELPKSRACRAYHRICPAKKKAKYSGFNSNTNSIRLFQPNELLVPCPEQALPKDYSEFSAQFNGGTVGSYHGRYAKTAFLFVHTALAYEAAASGKP